MGSTSPFAVSGTRASSGDAVELLLARRVPEHLPARAGAPDAGPEPVPRPGLLARGAHAGPDELREKEKLAEAHGADPRSDTSRTARRGGWSPRARDERARPRGGHPGQS